MALAAEAAAKDAKHFKTHRMGNWLGELEDKPVHRVDKKLSQFDQSGTGCHSCGGKHHLS